MRGNRRAAATVTAGLLGGATNVVLRRMEIAYARTDTLSNGVVTAMYATYAAHAAALSWSGARRVWPVPLPARSSRILGSALAGGGFGIVLAGARPFGAGAQLSGTEPGSLHATGIYRYSRNPQYLGLGLLATGVATATRSAFAAFDAAGVWLAFHRWVPSEEHHLTRIFGDRYTNYQASVRRWLGTRPQSGQH